MKRFNKTAIALATAGAVTFAAIPNADAQTGAVQADTDNAATNISELTDVPPAPAPSSPTPADGQDAGVNQATDAPDDAKEIDKLKEQAANPDFRSGTVGDITCVVPLPTGKTERVTFYAHADQFNWVADPKQNTGALPAEYLKPADAQRMIQEGNCYAGGAGAPTPKPGEVKDDEIQAILAAAALAAVPLVIGGIIYKVVKDNQGKPVLVPADRPNQTPTPEDKANTDKLVKENADEIARQGAEKGVTASEGEADDAATRGVNADTGNNGIAKGLLGLVIASIMGAAVFMFGRRQLV